MDSSYPYTNSVNDGISKVLDEFSYIMSEGAIHRIIQLWLAKLDIKSTFQLIGISQVWIGIIPSTRTHVSHLDCTPPQKTSSTYWLIPNRTDQRACITWTIS